MSPAKSGADTLTVGYISAGSDTSMLIRGAQMQGISFTHDTLTIWQEGDVAWAQILGKVNTKLGETVVTNDYWTSAVFVRDAKGWHWRYWGGSEPTTH